MPRDALKTLFHPFEDGSLPLPASGSRSLFIGAEPGFRLPDGFDAALSLAQGFRPYFRELEGKGHPVTPRAEGQGYDFVLVLAGRHRGLNELQIAEAVERVADDGLVLVAGGKADGIASLRKRVSATAVVEGHLSKHHGVAFWFRRSQAGELAEKFRQDNPGALVEGRFQTAPGMFSFDRIDAGSRLLADSLPDDIKGAAADFCAGWGFLSTELVRRARTLTALDVYEADFESLEGARVNVTGSPAAPRFFWSDLLKEPAERRYDVIVMNPPFHQDRAADPELGRGLIQAAATALKQGGRLFMVANRRLPYEDTLTASFSRVVEIARDDSFKVFAAYR